MKTQILAVAALLVSLTISQKSQAQLTLVQGNLDLYQVGQTSNMPSIRSSLGCYPTDLQISGAQYVDKALLEGSVSSRKSVVIDLDTCDAAGMTPWIYGSFRSDVGTLSVKLISPSGVVHTAKVLPPRFRGDTYIYQIAANQAVGYDPVAQKYIYGTLEAGGKWTLLIESSKVAKVKSFYLSVDSNW